MRRVFARFFRWAGQLVGFFIAALKIILTIIAVLGVVIIPKLLMLLKVILGKLTSYKQTGNNDALVTVTRQLVIWTRVIAAVGVFSFGAAVLQWRALLRTDETTRESFSAVQRAFVTVTKLTFQPTRNADGRIVSWMFKPEIINSGGTPTKDMQYVSIGTDGPTKPTEGWSSPYPNVKFPEGPTDPDNVFNRPRFRHLPHAVLGPHATMTIALGGSGIGIDILRKNIDEGWRFYEYGVIHYNDIFPGSDPHVTKYCFEIGTIRDAMGEIEPTSGLCPHWNCADDECRTDRNAWVIEMTDSFARAGEQVPEELLSGPKF
jgi:hypothetical protein